MKPEASGHIDHSMMEVKAKELQNVVEVTSNESNSQGKIVDHFDLTAERKLRLKIDLFVVPVVALLYLCACVDRSNIGNARIAGLEKDLGLQKYDYNILLSIFLTADILCRLPSTLMCKLLGPSWRIPGMSFLSGILTICTAYCRNTGDLYAVRFLYGMAEAGLLPGIAYYLSRWYRRKELVFRMSLYTVMAPVAGACGGLLSSAILSLDHFGSLCRWQMLFAIEGIATCCVAIISVFIMTESPSTAIWLSEEEKNLVVFRVISENTAATEVLDKVHKAKIMRGMFSPITLATGLMFMLNNVTTPGLAFFAPTIIKTIYPQESVVSQQRHLVPPYATGAFFTIFWALLSWRLDRRNAFFMMTTPLMMAGFAIFLASEQSHIRYGATFLIASGSFVPGYLCDAQVAANVISDTARSTVLGMNMMLGTFGALASTWTFLPWDSPLYHFGNGLNLACSSSTFVVAGLLQLWMRKDNSRRDNMARDVALSDLNEREIQNLDWRHPEFRWKS